MMELLTTAAHSLAWGAHILLASILACIMPLSAALETSEKINLESPIVWIIAAAIGFAGIVFSLISLNIDLVQGLAAVIWFYTVGYCTPMILVYVSVLFIPDFRAIGSTDPLVNLDKLPPEAIQPIIAELNDFRNTPRFKRRFRCSWLDFTIRIPHVRRISASELRALYARATDRANASERALRQQAAELEARQEHELAQARSDFLAAMDPQQRGLLAAQLKAQAEADARIAHGVERIETENTRLRRTVSQLRRALADAGVNPVA